MKAFHNDFKIKEAYLARVRAHAAADEIIKGTYWGEGRGCAVGCTIHSSDHGAYETELGVPSVLALLEDRIFEGLPLDLAKTWPDRFLSAIKPGADLSNVWPQFAVWLLVDAEYGVIRYASSEKIKTAIERVAELYRTNGTKEQFLQARRNAADAYSADAYSADAYSAAAADAAAAAYSAADAAYADAAAYSAADAAADAAARKKAYTQQSEKLLELLASAP